MAFVVSLRRWLSLGIAYLVLGSLLGWHIYDERRAVDALERERLAVQARIIDENLSHQLTGTSMALASMREDLPHIAEPGMAAVNRRLRSLRDALPGVSVMSVLDANGTTIASSRREGAAPSVGHSEFFQIAQAGRDPAVLHISPPFAAGSEHLGIAASKVVLDRNGEFAGLVVAILEAGYFKVLLGSVLYAPDMWVSLAHGDGELVLTMPARSRVEGLDPDDGPRSLRDRHLASGQPATVMTGRDYAAGEKRMMAQRVIRPDNLRMDQSLAVGVSRDLGSIFGAWRRGAYLQGGAFVALMLMGAVWLYWHQQRNRAEIRLAADREVERLRTSAELRQSMERLRLTTELADIATWEYDFARDRVIRSANHDRLFGLQWQDHWDARTFAQTNHPDDRQQSRQIIRKSVIPGGPDHFAFDFRVVWPDGSVRWLWLRGGVTQRDATGRGLLLMGVVLDVTERKQAAQALRDSELRFRLAASTGNVWDWDFGKQQVSFPSGGLQALGYTELDMQITPSVLATILHPDDRARWQQAVMDHIRHRVPYDLDFRVRTQSGDYRWFNTKGQAQWDEDGRATYMAGTTFDISERKRAEEEIEKHVVQLQAALMSTVQVATTLNEMRDAYTSGHQRRVAEIAVALAAEIGLEENRMEGLRVAGYLHDIGKISIPAEILAKPGRLSRIEFQLIQTHPQAGYDVLKEVVFPWSVAEMVLQHHERMDGSGYPQGLEGNAILLEARILAVADVVEAMSSHRPYRPGFGVDAALAEIERGSGTLYDTAVAQACLRLFRAKGYGIPE